MGDFLIKEGTRVILQKSDDYKSCVVDKNSIIRIGKIRFTLDGLIGNAFGSLFQIKDEKLIPATSLPQNQPTEIQVCSTDKTNKELTESEDNQKIKQNDILKMRESGVSGKEIVDKLVENSQTFQTKTEFSQEKYIKKKKEKHIMLLRVLKPTTRLVFEMFYNRMPADVGYMRVDTFSQILSFINTVAGSHIGVIDTFKGLLVSAVLEQLGGSGAVIQLIPDNIFLKDCLKYYNLSEQSLGCHYHYNIEDLGTLQADADRESAQSEIAVADKPLGADGMDCESSVDQVTNDNPVAKDSKQSDNADKLSEAAGMDCESSVDQVINDNPANKDSIKSDIVVADKPLEADGMNCGSGDQVINDNRVVKDLKPSGITVADKPLEADGMDCESSVDQVINVNPSDKGVTQSDIVDKPLEADGINCASGNQVIKGNQSANGNGDSKEAIEPETVNRKRKLKEKRIKTPEALEAERQVRLQNSLKRQKAQRILLDKNLDGLIISSKFHPAPLLMRMLEFMNASRPVVVFSQHMEPLLDCYSKVKGSGLGLNLQISETWYREYQVLPQRTHPVVKMSGTGGYLLTFTTVES